MRVLQGQESIGAAAVELRAALDDGQLVVVPTDTVYGIAARADDETAVRALYAAKGRPVGQQTAVIFASLGQVGEHMPDLDPRSRWALNALLPGPWTLIVANPAGRWPWLTGGTPGPIGVRVPAGALDLPPIAATSANAAGRPTAATIDELDDDVADHVVVALDRGTLPAGNESTVLDVTAWARGDGEVHVLRDTAGRAGQALAALADGP